MKNRNKIYVLLQSILIFGIVLLLYGILNTMVSLQYETRNLGDCVSLVTGANLCDAIKNFKILLGICFLFSTILFSFRRKFGK